MSEHAEARGGNLHEEAGGSEARDRIRGRGRATGPEDVHGSGADVHGAAKHPEEGESLWILTVSPTLWALHFLACYLTAAVWCAKAAEAGAPLGWVRPAVVAYTVVTLAGIGINAWFGLRRHQVGTATVPHDFDTPEDRHRFLGFATLLLAGASAVATLYVALVAVYFETCY